MGGLDYGLDIYRKTALKHAARAFCICLLTAEIGLRLASSSFWQEWGRAELVGASSLTDYVTAVRIAVPSQTHVWLFGDSVLYGSALLEHHTPHWREKTVGSYLRRQDSQRNWSEISAEGLLIPDLRAIVQIAQPAARDTLIIELNYRMFSADAGQIENSYSRNFLAPAYQSDWEENLAAYSAYYRYAQIARYLFWQPSRETRVAQWLRFGKALGTGPAVDDELRANLLAMKISPYYSAPALAPQHAGLAALNAWLPELLQQKGRVLVFLTPQNWDLIGEYTDEKAYAKNRKILKNLPWPKNVIYVDWADRKPSQGRFLDHCHLDEVGNQELATWLLKELP